MINNSTIPWYMQDIILPAFVTLLTYIIINHLIYPLMNWYKIKVKLIIYTTQYANFISNDKYTAVEMELRRLAGEITAVIYDPLYKIYSKINLIPPPGVLEKLKHNLIGWANQLDNIDEFRRYLCIEAIKFELKIPNNYSELKHSLKDRLNELK